MEEINLEIKGMHCIGCVLGLEEELEKLDFIKKVKGDLETNRITITYNNKFDLDKVKSIVKSMGFEVV